MLTLARKMFGSVNDRKIRPTGRGFTLVEILCLIGIVSLLVGVAFAVVRVGKDRARGALCVSNRRQVAIAALQYATDNRLTDDASVSPVNLVGRGYMHITPCPCKGLYTLDKPGIVPRCTYHKESDE